MHKTSANTKLMDRNKLNIICQDTIDKKISNNTIALHILDNEGQRHAADAPRG